MKRDVQPYGQICISEAKSVLLEPNQCNCSRSQGCISGLMDAALASGMLIWSHGCKSGLMDEDLASGMLIWLHGRRSGLQKTALASGLMNMDLAAIVLIWF